MLLSEFEFELELEVMKNQKGYLNTLSILCTNQGQSAFTSARQVDYEPV